MEQQKWARLGEVEGLIKRELHTFIAFAEPFRTMSMRFNWTHLNPKELCPSRHEPCGLKGYMHDRAHVTMNVGLFDLNASNCENATPGVGWRVTDIFTRCASLLNGALSFRLQLKFARAYAHKLGPIAPCITWAFAVATGVSFTQVSVSTEESNQIRFTKRESL